jgi:hypothetical protein
VLAFAFRSAGNKGNSGWRLFSKLGISYLNCDPPTPPWITKSAVRFAAARCRFLFSKLLCFPERAFSSLIRSPHPNVSSYDAGSWLRVTELAKSSSATV